VKSNLIRVSPTTSVQTLLCNVDIAAWDELNQHIINAAVGQWRTYLCACVKAVGGYFDHKL